MYSGTAHLYDWVCRGEPGGDLGLIVYCQAPELYCGDGILGTSDGEACDDSNQVSGDGCSDTCQIEIVRLEQVVPRTDGVTITNF